MRALAAEPEENASTMPQSITDWMPPWMLQWLDVIVPGAQIALVLLLAWLLRRLLQRLILRLGSRYSLPAELVVGARRVGTLLIYAGAIMLVLERLGVSGEMLWAAFTGFAAVAAVAFFAAWSVLSNIFCAFLIFSTRPFRLYDHIELIDSADKPGLKGRVIDINLVYTTLEEAHDGAPASTLRVPNSLFFQRSVRRWNGEPPRPASALPSLPTTDSAPAP